MLITLVYVLLKEHVAETRHVTPKHAGPCGKQLKCLQYYIKPTETCIDHSHKK